LCLCVPAPRFFFRNLGARTAGPLNDSRREDLGRDPLVGIASTANRLQSTSVLYNDHFGSCPPHPGAHALPLNPHALSLDPAGFLQRLHMRVVAAVGVSLGGYSKDGGGGPRGRQFLDHPSTNRPFPIPIRDPPGHSASRNIGPGPPRKLTVRNRAMGHHHLWGEENIHAEHHLREPLARPQMKHMLRRPVAKAPLGCPTPCLCRCRSTKERRPPSRGWGRVVQVRLG
jgi:hypothetical protein